MSAERMSRREFCEFYEYANHSARCKLRAEFGQGNQAKGISPRESCERLGRSHA